MRASLFSPVVAPAAVSVALLGAVVAASACAPVLQNRTAEGGAPMALPPGLAETAHIASLRMSSGWVSTGEGFAETFSEEVLEETSQCAWGTYPLDLRVHVDEANRDGRLRMLLNGRGRHSLSAVAELTDPARGGVVVGRYPIEVTVETPDRFASLFGDREMLMSEAFGRAVCDAAFARNPRRPRA